MQNTRGGGGVLKINKVIAIWNDSFVMTNYNYDCWIHCYNATLDWQVFNFSIWKQTEIKRKKMVNIFVFLILNWKVLSSETFRVFFQSHVNVRSHLQKKFHEDLECLQMSHTTFKGNLGPIA